MKQKLIGIGYWHSLEQPDLPDPSWFQDKEWDAEEKNLVLLHLREGMTAFVCMGYSWCRFRCGENLAEMGACDWSDGYYIYPEGLIHYIEHHHVRLPPEFVNHIKAFKPRYVDYEAIDNQIDYAWWKGQRGWNTTAKSYRDLYDMGILTIESANASAKPQQEKLLKDFFAQAINVQRKLTSIDAILAGRTTTILGKFVNVEAFAAQATRCSLLVNFTELTYQEYDEYLIKLRNS